MSVIVIVKEKNKVYVGCDTRMSSEYGYTDGYCERPKAYKLADGTIIGAVGNVGLLDILKNYVQNLKEINRDVLVNNVVIPMIRDFRGSCFMANRNEFDGSMVIAKRDKAFIISNIGTVEEVFNCNAVGSGKMAALGSLQTSIMQPKDPIIKIAAAINAAGNLVPSVSKVAMIADTKENDFEEYEITSIK